MCQWRQHHSKQEALGTLACLSRVLGSFSNQISAKGGTVPHGSRTVCASCCSAAALAVHALGISIPHRLRSLKLMAIWVLWTALEPECSHMFRCRARASGQKLHSLAGVGASLALLTYDIIITLDIEFERVWPSAWSLPKVLYIISRYLGFMSLLSTTLVDTFATTSALCNVYTPIYELIIALIAASSDGLLLMRVMALFQHRRCLCRSLQVMFTTVYIVEIVFCCFNFYFQLHASTEAENIGCLSTTGFGTWGTKLAVVPGMPLIAYNSVLFILTVIKLFPSWRPGHDLQTPVTTLFIRDGAMYFVLICSVFTVWVVMPFTHADRPGIVFIGLQWVVAISSIASCRLLLNLRTLGRPSQSEPSLHTAEFTRPVFNIASADTTDMISGAEDEGPVDDFVFSDLSTARDSS